MKTIIVPTFSARHLAEIIQNKTLDEIEVIFPNNNSKLNQVRFFPDGEIRAKLPVGLLKRGGSKRVILLHSGAPDPNNGLIELELLLRILKDHKIQPELFFSYFPYGKQDSVFEPGETNAAEGIINKFQKYYNVKKIYIIDSHFSKRPWLEKYRIKEITAVPLLINNAKKYLGNNIVLVSPDLGGKRRTGIRGANKQRASSDEVKISTKDFNFKGETVCVVDDMIATGGTLIKFFESAKKEGAKEVVALITHGVIPEGVKKVKAVYSKLYLTNTVNQNEANVDVSNLILNSVL